MTILPSGLALGLVVVLWLLASPSPASSAEHSPAQVEHPKGETIIFADFEWHVKHSVDEPVGPGPNLFCSNNVEVVDTHLHLRIAPDREGRWCSAEVKGPRLGYGLYRFVVELPERRLDPNAVVGLFTWSNDPSYAHREIDIELSRFANPQTELNAQCVVQPYTNPANLVRFHVPEDQPLVYEFSWRTDSVHCEVTTLSGRQIFAHTFTENIPPPGDAAVRINLWSFVPDAPMEGKPQEVVVRSFVHEEVTASVMPR